MVTKMKELKLSPMQEEGVALIEDWYIDKHAKKWFHLAGFAGTGKTTLVDYAIERLRIDPKRVGFACYTGMAALQLTKKAKGEYVASTIHSLIYNVREDKGATHFVLKEKKDLKNIKMFIIDEWSMVSADILEDLMSFGKKVLFIGDLGQLPPVSQDTRSELLETIRNNPDYTLTEIHRQALESPIIYLSMLARTKQPIPYGAYGKNKEVVVMSKAQWHNVRHRVYGSAGQIICGYNKTRKSLNEEIRQTLGYTSPYPQEGDKLVCLKNNWSKSNGEFAMVNGLTGTVQKPRRYKDGPINTIKIDFEPSFESMKFKGLKIPQEMFEGEKPVIPSHMRKEYCEFDYGYAITCHKSQGSQYDNLVVISEVLNRENHHKWLYTAITRATEKLILVI